MQPPAPASFKKTDMEINTNDYQIAGSKSMMGKKLHSILDFTLRGLECNMHTACDNNNNETIRNYHEGKAQAFREVLTFFEGYIKDKDEEED